MPAHHRSFLPKWQRPISTAEQQQQDTLQSSAAYYNTHAHPLSDIKIGSRVTIQNLQTKAWDIYCIVIEVSPERHYYVKTQGERVLVRNRRFIRHRTPTSIPNHTTGCSQTHTSQPPPPWQSPRDKKPMYQAAH